MTNGDGLNKRAPGQSQLSKVVVEVLESIVRVDSRFSLLSPTLPVWHRAEALRTVAVELLCLPGKSKPGTTEFLGNSKVKNIFQSFSRTPPLASLFCAVIVLTSSH